MLFLTFNHFVMKKIILIVILVMTVLAVKSQRTQVQVSALPDPIPRFLNTYYPGFVTEKEYRVVTNNNEITYETVITKGTTQETLVFDQNGKFLRKDVGSKPILKNVRVNTANPSINKNINIKTKQPTVNIKNVGELPEERIQKNEPDTIYIKK
jgi:hypothetical protein